MKLWEVATLIRSKNAGTFELTFDIMFSDDASYEKVVASDVLNRTYFSNVYHCSYQDVHLYLCPNARGIKITIPRLSVQGTFGDPDLHGGQQYAPLLNLEI